ncbi:hypothetical protein L226DRAFT_71279 [Lentinus tigrinus ALCF2SS1-7]|uniref:uncharacterized protein n=1 Tax=Lentinus tigrinus ALCF2SS1-7 TaxID=1328758 RepID=UPI00116617B5|nr:hypothetical protein L226DRAFT_71279 [Lentinus tigrinus ALCF2SS1-7]
MHWFRVRSSVEYSVSGFGSAEFASSEPMATSAGQAISGVRTRCTRCKLDLRVFLGSILGMGVLGGRRRTRWRGIGRTRCAGWHMEFEVRWFTRCPGGSEGVRGCA